MDNFDKTMFFDNEKSNLEVKKEYIQSILKEVYQALVEKGYDPIKQLVGYVISGDPTYITNYKNARALIGSLDRDELLEQMIRKYLGI